MSTTFRESQAVFDELEPGDSIEVDHTVKVGAQSWAAKKSGTVVRTERRRHGLHIDRAADDKVFSDVILLKLPDGELTTVTIDDYTSVRRV